MERDRDESGLPGDRVERSPGNFLDVGTSYKSIFNVAGKVGDMLAMLSGGGKSRLDELKEAVLEAQLSKLKGELNQKPIVALGAEDVLRMAAYDKTGRQDWIILGERGYGKSVLAFWIAQVLQEHQGRPAYAVDFPPSQAKKLGIGCCGTQDVDNLRECIIVIDEAGIGYGKGGKARYDLRGVLSVARHRKISVIWVAQNAAQLSPEVLRYGCVLGFKYLDPIAWRFDREELKDLMEEVRGLQSAYEELCQPQGFVAYVKGKPYASANGLPHGWDEEASTWTEVPSDVADMTEYGIPGIPPEGR